MNINGINRVLSGSGEMVYFYTNEMLQDNILVVQESIYGENNELRERVSLIHYNDNDAQFYGLYEGEYIDTIQVYGMVKNLVELYNNSPLNVFLEYVHELSNSSMFSSYQSKDENKQEIREWILEYFEVFKEEI